MSVPKTFVVIAGIRDTHFECVRFKVVVLTYLYQNMGLLFAVSVLVRHKSGRRGRSKSAAQCQHYGTGISGDFTFIVLW
jgi:hypothetical protein